MKINKTAFLGLAAAALLSGGCTEEQLTAVPSGSTMTDEQLAQAQTLNPALVSATLDGMYGRLIQYDGVSSNIHDRFSYAKFMLDSDLWGQDMVHFSNTSYFAASYDYASRRYDGSDIFYLWDLFYSIIDKSHEIIRTITPETAEGNTTYRHALAQARAMRAFAYLHLVQMYRHTDNYAAEKALPAVPIITENTTSAEAGNNPPATMGEVFDRMILPDLEYAVTGLEGFTRAGKQYIDKQVAQGLLARAYMVTGNWSGAARLAAAARAGLNPMTAQQYVDPATGFNEISNPAWIWGSDVTSSSRVTTTGICNFGSFISTFVYGYAALQGQWKLISAELYNRIPDSDIRKSAFCAQNTMFGTFGNPPLRYQSPRYGNVKFRPVGGQIGISSNPADIPMMRVEEMILLEAEAKVRDGNPTAGRDLMVDLIKTCRNPGYAFAGTSAQEVLDEIWLQRRIEFWGEGLSWFDMKRFGKPVERNYEGSNFQATVRYTIPAGSPKFLISYPRQEMINNTGIPQNINSDGREGIPAL